MVHHDIADLLPLGALGKPADVLSEFLDADESGCHGEAEKCVSEVYTFWRARARAIDVPSLPPREPEDDEAVRSPQRQGEPGRD